MFKLEIAPQLSTHKAFCQLPFNRVILNGWGDVSMCCYQYHQLGSLLNGANLLDLWNSPKAKQIREETTKGNLHPVCKSWNTCPFLVQEKIVYEFEAYKNFDYPTWIEICLPNTHCNIGGENPSDDNPACIMCCRNYDMKAQPNITDLLCEKALPCMPYIKNLTVLGISEPFWKDAVFRVFEKLDFHLYKKNVLFTTNTNVVCLTERVTQRFFQEVYKSSVSFSLDAATPETYIKIRRVPGYEMVIENLHTYMEYREKNGGKDRHEAVIYNNINILNVNEMTAMVETAAVTKVDKIIMLPTHDQCGRVKMDELMLNEKNVKIFKKAALDAQKRAIELGVNLHYSKPFDVVPPPIGQELVQLQL
jgi:hypothetical protein